MNFSLWMSNRMRLNGSGGTTNATGIVIAVAGVALALAIMECTIASVVGFKNEITNRLTGFDGQVSVLPAYDYETAQSEPYLTLNDTLASMVSAALPQAEAVLKLKQPGILKTDSDFSGAYFIGYGPGYSYSFESDKIIDGVMPDFKQNPNSIVISKHQAKELRLNVGDKVNAFFFANDAVKNRRYEIAGIYETGFSDYDKTAVFASISNLQGVAAIDSFSATEINISGIPTAQIEEKAYQLQSKLLTAYNQDEIAQLHPVDNIKHTGAIFFNWLNLLDTNVVVIFILMACVSGFTLISSLFILILDRIPTIGLLRALGATKRQIRMVFINLAMKTVALGLILGNLIGLSLILAQHHWRIVKLDPEMYYLSYAPVEINWWWILLLNAAVAAAAWALLILPSRVAASISPAQTMRFE